MTGVTGRAYSGYKNRPGRVAETSDPSAAVTDHYASIPSILELNSPSGRRLSTIDSFGLRSPAHPSLRRIFGRVCPAPSTRSGADCRKAVGRNNRSRERQAGAASGVLSIGLGSVVRDIDSARLHRRNPTGTGRDLEIVGVGKTVGIHIAKGRVFF